MQPRWLPTLRAGIGVTIMLSAVLALFFARPWERAAIPVVLAWAGLGLFLIWASRRERSGTLLGAEEIVVTSGRQVHRLTRVEILDLRHDRPEPYAARVQAVLRDGSRLTLLAVPPAELQRLRRWHLDPSGQ